MPTIEIMDRDRRVVGTLPPISIPQPAAVRLREQLSLPETATDEELMSELRSLHRSAACDGCRFGGSDGRGHFACGAYHPAWDVAEEMGIADAHLDRQWVWVLNDENI